MSKQTLKLEEAAWSRLRKSIVACNLSSYTGDHGETKHFLFSQVNGVYNNAAIQGNIYYQL